MPDSEGDGEPLSRVWRQEQLHSASCLNVVEAVETEGPEILAFCMVFYSEFRCVASRDSRVNNVRMGKIEPHRLRMLLGDVSVLVWKKANFEATRSRGDGAAAELTSCIEARAEVDRNTLHSARGAVVV